MLLSQSLLGAVAWGFAVLHFAYCHNSVPNTKTGPQRCPDHMMSGKTGLPDIGNRFKFPFGTLTVHKRVGKRGRWEFASNNVLGIVVGSDTEGNGGSRIYSPLMGIGLVSYPRVNVTQVRIRNLPSPTAADIENMGPALTIEEDTGAVTFTSPNAEFHGCGGDNILGRLVVKQPARWTGTANGSHYTTTDMAAANATFDEWTP